MWNFTFTTHGIQVSQGIKIKKDLPFFLSFCVLIVINAYCGLYTFRPVYPQSSSKVNTNNLTAEGTEVW